MASVRNYLSIAELEEFADITVTDTEEAFDQISQAEELIDAFVGPQQKFIRGRYSGEVSSVNAKTIFDIGGGTQLAAQDDFFTGCQLEIVGGSGAGQRRTISASDYEDRSITYTGDTLSPQVDTTSIFFIYQIAKFPRRQDVTNNRAGNKYYKAIPEAVRRATAAQVQFMISMGEEFFAGAGADLKSEQFLNYSYTKNGGNSGSSSLSNLISPKAKALLRGITNRRGQLNTGGPSVRI